MTEKTLPTTPVEKPYEGVEHDDYSPGELEQLGIAAHGAEDVLERAISNGEPSHRVVETDRGIKGFVEGSIPGGRIEGMFDGTGESARLEELHILLDDDSGVHEVGVRFKENGDALIFVDGEPVRPEDIPAVAAVIDRIGAEQQANEDNHPERETGLVEVSGKMADLESMSADLGAISERLEQVQEKLEGIQGELGGIGEKLGKLFEELVGLLVILQDALNEIAREADSEKQEEMKKDLQNKINETAARIEAIAGS